MHNALRLTLLAALWGGSFVFIRMGAHDVAPAVLVFCRVAIAAVIMGLVLRRFPRITAVDVAVGVLNSAVPFTLIAFAAKSLDASLLSILNASAPAFAAIVGAGVARRAPPPRVTAGLALGIAGVGIASSGALRAGGATVTVAAAVPIACALAAALSYGVAAVVAKRRTAVVDPVEAGAASMVTASAAVAIPALFAFTRMPAAPLSSWAAVLALGTACTGLGYLLYFRLVKDAGPTAALSVTFLVPIFGVLWGALFLHEHITVRAVAGGVVIVIGTLLTAAPVSPSPPMLARLLNARLARTPRTAAGRGGSA